IAPELYEPQQASENPQPIPQPNPTGLARAIAPHLYGNPNDPPVEEKQTQPEPGVRQERDENKSSIETNKGVASKSEEVLQAFVTPTTDPSPGANIDSEHLQPDSETTLSETATPQNNGSEEVQILTDLRLNLDGSSPNNSTAFPTLLDGPYRDLLLYINGEEGRNPAVQDFRQLNQQNEFPTREQIVEIQRIVGAKEDGIYGPETEQKVADWQARHGVGGTPGVLTPELYQAMIRKSNSPQPPTNGTIRLPPNSISAPPPFTQNPIPTPPPFTQNPIPASPSFTQNPIPASPLFTPQFGSTSVDPREQEIQSLLSTKAWLDATINRVRALRLTREQIISIQGSLNNSWALIGMREPLTVDGEVGPQTIEAIARFQQYNGLDVDGIPGPNTLNALSPADLSPSQTFSQITTEGSNNLPPFQPVSDANIDRILENSRRQGELAGLEIDVKFKLSNNPDRVADIQSSLNNFFEQQGMSRRLAVDGEVGPQTLEAIRFFQQHEGIDINNIIDTLNAIEDYNSNNGANVSEPITEEPFGAVASPPIPNNNNPAPERRAQLDAFSPAIQIILGGSDTFQPENYPDLLRVGDRLEQLPTEEFQAIYRPLVEDFAGDLPRIERALDTFTETQSQVLAGFQQTSQGGDAEQRVNNLLFSEKQVTTDSSWQQVLADLITSVIRSPQYLDDELGELFEFVKDHWVSFVATTVALIGAQAAVVVLTGIPEPTFLSKVIAIALQGLILTVFGVGIVVSVTNAIGELMNWWDAAKAANGDPDKIATASRAFLRMIGHLLLLIANTKKLRDRVQGEEFARFFDMLRRPGRPGTQPPTRLPNDSSAIQPGSTGQRALRPTAPSALTAESSSIAPAQEGVVTRLEGIPDIDINQHSITQLGNDLIGIDNQIEIHPSLLDTLPDEEVGRLLQVTRELEANGGNVGALSSDNKESLKHFERNYRLRFNAKLNPAVEQLQTILSDLGVQADSEAVQFLNEMNLVERMAIDRIISAGLPKKAGELRYQAIDYALSRTPSSAGEFANYFEMYVADFNRHSLELRENYIERVNETIAARGASSQAEQDAIRREISSDLFGGRETTATSRDNKNLKKIAAARVQEILGQSDNPRYVNSTGQQRVSDAYQQKADDLNNRVGARQIEPDLADGELVTAIQALDDVRFTSESSAVYHAHKHYNELPQSERTGTSEIENYLESANRTIREGAATVNLSQTGSRSVTVVKTVVGDDGRPVNLTAILYVSPDGNVVLASYQGKR
ncbi:MAG: peptidoglycan-binding protein, partial [Cyanobacteriota bacterium]|nr:peptidoglycan-binding protein [Cyanobacteriota bacterium]